MSERQSTDCHSDVPSDAVAHQLVATVRLPRILGVLLTTMGILVVLYPIMEWLTPSPVVDAGLRIFDLNGEANAPAWYSTVLWFSASISAWLLYHAKSRLSDFYSKYWLGLSAVFLFMSLDESAMIHETIGALNDSLSTPGFFFYSWTIIWLVFVGLFAIVYVKFVLNLERNVRAILVISALTFVSGALGVEMVTAAAESQTLALLPGIKWGMLIMLEELLEMLGLVLLNMGLFMQMKKQGSICICLS